MNASFPDRLFSRFPTDFVFVQVVGLLLPNQTLVSTVFWQVNLCFFTCKTQTGKILSTFSFRQIDWAEEMMSDGNRSVTHEVSPHVNQPAHLVLQWLNQSHNACVNYSNRNASKVRRPQLSSSDTHSFCHLAVVKTSHLFFTPAGPSFQICPGIPGSGDQRSLHCCEFP